MESSLPTTTPLNGGDGIHTSPFFSALSSTQMGAAEPKEQHFSANDIQRLLNNSVDDFDNAKWTGSIFLDVIPISSADKDVGATLSSQKPIKVDICKYINDKKKEYMVLYFDPRVYKPPRDGSKYVPSANLKHKKIGDKNFKYANEDDKIFTNLKDCIERASVESDSSVICNGTNSSAKNTRKFVCYFSYRDRKDNTANETESNNGDNKVSVEPKSLNTAYRQTYMINNDKKGRRDDGRSGPRRTSVAQTLRKGGFKFVLKWDEYGYYIELRWSSGCNLHLYHPQPIPNSTSLPSRLYTEEDIETIQHITKSSFNNGNGRNYAFTRLGSYLSRAKVAYMNSGPDKDKDEVDRMFEWMEKSESVEYNVCWDPSKSDDKGAPLETKPPSSQASSLVSTTKVGGGEVTHADVGDDPTMHYIAGEVEKARADQNIEDDNNVFVSIAWTTISARRYFKLNPECVTCDITSHTNKNGYHLMTFSVKAVPLDKQVVFLWIWLPNQRRYSFRWVFQHAIKKLIPKHHLQRVKFIMKDGDPQQHNEVMAAIVSTFGGDVTVGGCGWHIVHCTWVKYIGKARCYIRSENYAEWDKIHLMIHSFIYCWMKRGGVEDDEEYELSKQILFDFIRGPKVKAVCDGNQDFISKIIEWLTHHVLVHENTFLHYRNRKGVCTFQTSTSSPHEGGNFGIKSHSASVKPTMSMDKSAEALALQSNLKVQELDHACERDYKKRNKKWSTLPTSPYTTMHAEGLLHVAVMRRNMYTVRRVGTHSFEVEYTGENGEMKDILDCGIFPLFSRIRRVTITEDSKLSCSCCAFEEDGGMPCPHMASVLDAITKAAGEEWKGFNICDVGVRWRSSYNYLAYRQTTDERVNTLFHWLATNGIKGPSLTCDINPSMPIEVPQKDLPANLRLKNYSPDDIGCDCGMFDAHLRSRTHKTEDYDTSKSQYSYVKAAERLFEDSIRDEVGCETSAAVGIRSSLGQIWNEACDAADQAKDPELNKELAECLKKFISSAHAKARENNESKESTKKRKGGTVMLNPHQHMGPKRVYNTHSMG